MTVENPYLEQFHQLFGTGPIHWWDVRHNAGTHRELLQRYYAFAIPNEAALATLAAHAPLVEMGAGTGYWASLLHERGVDILAYDRDPEENPYALSRIWTEVTPTSDHMQTVREHAGRTLFLCWPDNRAPFADECLRAYGYAGGQTFIFAGEERGGCTGDDAFFDLLEVGWTEVERVAIPQWPGSADSLRVYRRREP